MSNTFGSELRRPIRGKREAKERKWRGGVWLNASGWTWPFATLTIDSDNLILKTPKLLFGRTYEFKRDQISKISSWGLIPFIGKPSIRINHNVSSYPKDIIFTTRDSKRLLNKLAEYGYPVIMSKPSKSL